LRRKTTRILVEFVNPTHARQVSPSGETIMDIDLTPEG